MEIALFDPQKDSPTKGELITVDLVGLPSGVGGNHGL